MSDWKTYATMAAIALVVVALAHNGVLSFVPGLPAKQV